MCNRRPIDGPRIFPVGHTNIWAQYDPVSTTRAEGRPHREAPRPGPRSWWFFFLACQDRPQGAEELETWRLAFPVSYLHESILSITNCTPWMMGGGGLRQNKKQKANHRHLNGTRSNHVCLAGAPTSRLLRATSANGRHHPSLDRHTERPHSSCPRDLLRCCSSACFNEVPSHRVPRIGTLRRLRISRRWDVREENSRDPPSGLTRRSPPPPSPPPPTPGDPAWLCILARHVARQVWGPGPTGKVFRGLTYTFIESVAIRLSLVLYVCTRHVY